MSKQSYRSTRSHMPLIAALLMIPGISAAVTLSWPNLSPIGACRGTLQACIDAAAPGDTVQIVADDLLFPDRYTFIDETLVISKSLTLRGAAGIDAVFVAGRGISVSPPSVALTAYTVSVEDLILDRGSIVVLDRALLASTYRVQGVRINDVPVNQCGIRMDAQFGTVPNFQALRNVIRIAADAPAGDASGICFGSSAANWQMTAVGNRFEALSGGASRGVVVNSSSAGPINISGNTVVGRSIRSGIEVLQTVGTARALVQVVNNSVSGQDADPAAFAAGLLFILSDADVQIINNTVVDGRSGLIVGSFATAPPVNGLVANNLVAFHAGEGLTIDPSVAAAFSNRNNLVFGNAFDNFPAGPGTVNSDPQLIGLTYPRIRDSSPAINAGSNSALPPFNGFDADGQPRVMLATIDIGAYEAGFAVTGVHVADAGNITANQTDVVGLAGVALAPGALLAVTSLRTPDAAAAAAQNIGVWLPLGSGSLPLSIFHENNAVAMPVGRRFAATTPGFGLSGFTHSSTLGNISAQYTMLSNSALDGRPGAIAVVTHNYLTSGPYHDFAIGLEYVGTRWHLRNEDPAVDMPGARDFNVVVAPELSENAFRVAAPASAPVSEIPVPHPLLDDNACAAPIVGRVDAIAAPTVFNTTAFSVEFRSGSSGAPGRWFVVAENGGSPAFATFPAGAAFNVIIDGAQANGCRAPVADLMFTNGFE
jgi:hypothetical protein